MRAPYEYAALRVVPRVEREEFVNAGILLFCEARDVIVSRTELDARRLLALWPDVDLALVRAHLEATDRICKGGPEAGEMGRLPTRERWRWLVAPRSTVIQTSAAHGGLAEDGMSTEAIVERLLERMVRAPVTQP